MKGRNFFFQNYFSEALCVIFTILVSFLQDNAQFASKAKINARCLQFFRTEQPLRSQRSEKKFQTTLILVFEVIVQPPKKKFFDIFK